MSKIHVLDKHTAELIAAGEVVERPSSVVKELLENSIDAGASSIVVEIQNGGVRLIRITDNGSGIARDDVPVAFLRHATSKVRTQDDLDAIGTLGFRGEALASICAVARVELITRTAEELAGTRYLIEGGEEQGTEDTGCPRGTTIVVHDLFYNVPARMKFLKKDVSESNSVAGVVERIALSHPEISVRFIRDGKEELLTPGDGELLSCIYTVFGREFAAGLLPLDYALNGVHVHGYISKPGSSRANRTMQHFFINGRYVKTRTAMAALEEAYKGSIMVGKFPACILHIDLPLETVDVNVHPAKIEVRFTNEKPLFDAVYHGVKTALQGGDARVSMTLPAKKVPIAPPSVKTSPEQLTFGKEQTARTTIKHIVDSDLPDEPVPNRVTMASPVRKEQRPNPPVPQGIPMMMRDGSALPYNRPLMVPDIFCDEDGISAVPPVTGQKHLQKPDAPPVDQKPSDGSDSQFPVQETLQPEQQRMQQQMLDEKPGVRFLGEAFSTYIIAQWGSTLYFIDKHAAHERILYNQLRASEHVDAQMLLAPVSVLLSREEYAALIPELDTLQRAGFVVEDFGGCSVLVRAVPMMLDGGDAAAMIQEIAGALAAGKREITTDKLDWIYHSASCRAAIKAGDFSRPEELQAMAERVLLNDDIRTCPHGRPVCYELTRHELEKQFGRAK